MWPRLQWHHMSLTSCDLTCQLVIPSGTCEQPQLRTERDGFRGFNRQLHGLPCPRDRSPIIEFLHFVSRSNFHQGSALSLTSATHSQSSVRGRSSQPLQEKLAECETFRDILCGQVDISVTGGYQTKIFLNSRLTPCKATLMPVLQAPLMVVPT